MTVTDFPWDGGVIATEASPAIPLGCICSYTWGAFGTSVRNGAMKSCPADHSAIDGHAARA
jgi:hypothetical protein